MSVLPAEMTLPIFDLMKLIILIYGVPKIGKSTFCSNAEDVLFLATEPGLKALSVFAVQVNCWKDIIAAGNELAKSDRFKTIVVDTVDIAYQLCMDHTCKVHNIKHPQDLDYGKGWSLVNREFSRVMTTMANLDRGLIFVSHAQEITLKSPTAEINKAVPTLGGKSRDFIMGLSDIILYAEINETKKGHERIVHATPSMEWEAGDRTGRLPEVLPLDWNAVATALKGDDA